MALRRTLLALLAVAVCSGCVEIRETIRLKKDGSGTARLQVTFPQLGLRWLPGKPSADWLRPGLPDGVQLTSFESVQKKTKLTGPDGEQHDILSESYNIDLTFENVESLNGLRIRPDSRNAMAAASGGTPGKAGEDGMAAAETAPRIGPFQRVSLRRQGNELHFRRVVQDARDPDEIEAAAMSRPGSAARPEAIDLADSSIVISIVCPGDVVKHNAHQVKGRTLTWNFKLKDLQAHQDRDWIVEFTCRQEANE